jgi:hypothetical protein
MLNFAEQTGSGAVMLVWSFLHPGDAKMILYTASFLPHVHRTLDATLFTPGQPEQCDRHGACFLQFTIAPNMTQQHPRFANGRDMTRIENFCGSNPRHDLATFLSN